MGTRADFYLGRDKQAEWLGSIAWDGIEIPDAIREAYSASDYRREVLAFLAERDDATFPKDGWPWPWDTSDTTDCSYWFFDGHMHYAAGDYHSRERYVPWSVGYDENEDRWFKFLETSCPLVDFPDMGAFKKVTFGKRSGLIVIAR